MRHTEKLKSVAMSAAVTLSAAVLPLTSVAADSTLPLTGLRCYIPAQDLEKALESFANARGIHVRYTPDQVEGLKTAGVDGSFTAPEELRTLLAGTGLTFQFTRENDVSLVPTPAAQFVATATGTAIGGGAANEGSGPLRLAQAGQRSGATTNANSATGAAPTSVADFDSHVPLDEVTVTAQKRSEHLLTVPLPVTALEAADLLNYNQLRFQDYFDQVPGLDLAPGRGRGTPQVAIRGIIAGQGNNPTVGVTIDGVPFGSSISNGFGNVAPDLDPSDLARVEVLRGPQGTLYGANSLGGQLQYVTVDPSTDRFSGRVSTGLSDVQNGVNAGYNVRGSINIPITDDLAVRVSGFTRRDPGYIDDVVNFVSGVNQLKDYGGHLVALWKPTEDFSVKFSTIQQHTEQFGSNYADVLMPGQNLGQLTIGATPIPPTNPNNPGLPLGPTPNAGVYDNRIQNYSLTLDYTWSTFDLTSISSFSQDNTYDRLDSPTLVSYNACVFPHLVPSYFNAFGVACSSSPPKAPATAGTTATTATIKKYTEELRLTTPLGRNVDWLFGVFFTKEIGDVPQEFDAASQLNGATLATQYVATGRSTVRDEAIFTDFTFNINPAFDVQVGGRANIDRQSFSSDTEGGYTVLPDSPYQAGVIRFPDSKFTSYTYLLTPRYFLLKDGPETLMTYARFSSGFRPGGPNPSFGLPGIGTTGIPQTYGGDKTYDYDLGLKADLLDRRLTLDLSLFYIDWKNIQLTTNLANGNGGVANGSGAKSQGVEFQTQVRPWMGLTIDANFTYDDARLRSSVDPSADVFGNAGDRLPYTAQYSGNFNLNQEFPIPFGSRVRGFVGGELSYIGGRLDFFQSLANAAIPRQEYPAYTQVNLRTGATWYTWSAQIYATNVTDKRGLLSGGNPNESPTPFRYLFINPRTVGFEISETF